MHLHDNHDPLEPADVVFRCAALPWRQLWRRGEFLFLLLMAPFAGFIWFVFTVAPVILLLSWGLGWNERLTQTLGIVGMSVVIPIVCFLVWWPLSQASRCCFVLTKQTLVIRGLELRYGIARLKTYKVSLNELRDVKVILDSIQQSPDSDPLPDLDPRRPDTLTLHVVKNYLLLESDQERHLCCYLRDLYEMEQLVGLINALCEERVIVRPVIFENPTNFPTVVKLFIWLKSKLSRS